MESISVSVLLLSIFSLWGFVGMMVWRQQRYVAFLAWMVVSFWGGIAALCCCESVWILAGRLCKKIIG